MTDVTHTINQNDRKEQIAQRTARVVTTVVWIRKAKGAWSGREPGGVREPSVLASLPLNQGCVYI